MRKSIYLLMLIAAGLALLLTIDKSPSDPVSARGLVDSGPADRKAVAIMCNVAWGEEYLIPMLKVLAAKGVKITFFIEGQWAYKNPELVREIMAQGHEVENHGYQHVYPTKLSRKDLISDISRTRDILQDITRRKTIYYHPPYRDFNDYVVNTAYDTGHITVINNIDTIDWQKPAPEIILQRVKKKLRNGGIILIHPTAPTVLALPILIDQIRQEGYEIESIGKLLTNMSS